MTTSPLVGLPLIDTQQAQPEVAHNTALLLLQALFNGVKDKDLATPPVGPADGDAYIVAGSPTGAWVGWANHIAIWYVNAWFFVPGFTTAGAIIAMGANQEGLTVWVRDEDVTYVWNGAAWAIPAVSIANNSVALAKLVNAGAQYDIIGRKTASAGSWEDCTRTDLKLAGTDLANTFALAQVIDSGTGALPTPVSGTQLTFSAPDTVAPALVFEGFATNGQFLFRRANGTRAVPTAVATTNALGGVVARGYGATGYSAGGRVGLFFRATENWSDTVQGAEVTFTVTPNGGIASMTPWRFRNDGSLVADASVGGVTGNGTVNGVRYFRNGIALNSAAAVATDADFTMVVGTNQNHIQHTGTLTANRTVTLSTSGVVDGDEFTFTRTGAGAFNLSIGGLKNLATNTWCRVKVVGGAWVLQAYGAL